MKPKLLIVELWGLGDLVIATPFVRAMSERYDVTLLAKPFAQDLQRRFWPGARVEPFTAPWTAFKGKYRLHQYPWGQMYRVRRQLAAERFDVGLSARWDPRDHLLLRLLGTRSRFGFPRRGSRVLLTHPLTRPAPTDHRYEYWRVIARALDVIIPQRGKIPLPPRQADGAVLVHSGAGQPVRVWPLERYARLVARLRQAGHRTLVVCDPDQRDWWLHQGETAVATPSTVTGLLALVDQAAVFIGNDSGPGHLAAFCGVPTFTFFGPQLPEWFAPLHPASEWLEGKACPYKPCSDYCRFKAPRCLENITEEEVWSRLDGFMAQHGQPVAAIA